MKTRMRQLKLRMCVRSLPLKGHQLPLHFAVYNKRTTEIRALIERGTNVNAYDEFKTTPLMLCCLESDETWSAGIVMMLLQAGASASLTDADGRNALMVATIFKRKQIINLLLLAKDYNVNERDGFGRSAFHYACLIGDKDVVKLVGRASLDIPPAHSDSSMRSESIDRDGQPKFRHEIWAMRNRCVPEPCKSIINEFTMNARIHKSNSFMNVHQFRRATVKQYFCQSAEKAKSIDLSFGKYLSTARPSSTLVTSYRSFQRLPRSPVRLSATSHQTRSRCSSQSINSSEMWKASVPPLWHLLSQHCSPSYRRAAVPVSQTFEEALHLPPKEEVSGDDEVPKDDQQIIRNSGTPPRRSSMPNPTPSSQAAYSGKPRRRSEVVGLSANTFAKFFAGDQNLNNIVGLSATKENKRLKRADTDVSSNLITENNEGRGRRGSSPTDAPTPPFRRVSTTRRYSLKSKDSGGTKQSMPTSQVEEPQNTPEESELPTDTVKEPTSNGSSNITNIERKERSETDTDGSKPVRNDTPTIVSSVTVDKDKQFATPRRSRHDSILQLDRVLSNIREEDETTSPT